MTTPSNESAGGVGSSSSPSPHVRICATIDRVLQSKSVLPLRPLLHLIAFYPLLLVVPVVLLLFAWDVLMSDYDAFHQLWSEKPLTGILVGFFAAVVLGQAVLAVYLFDEARGNPAAAAARRLPLPPRWAYWGAWGLLLLAAIAPAAVLSDNFAAPGNGQARAAAARYWFPLGVLLAVLAFGALRLAAPRWFEFPERVGYAVTLAIVGGFVLMTAAHAAYPAMYCPWVPGAVNLLLLLGFITALFALFTYHARRHTPLLYPALLGLFIVPFLIPACQTEYRVPNMEVAGEGVSYYEQPYRLAGYTELRRAQIANGQTDNGLNPEGTARLEAAGLLNDEGALRAWHARMMQKYGEPQPVVVVTVSGGASASAIYCADVLFTLEEMFPGFSDRIRLVSGASGGMLGASYFVTQLRPGGLIAAARESNEYRAYVEAMKASQAESSAGALDRLAAAEHGYRELMKTVREKFFHGLEQDFLGPLVQKWVHQDMPLGVLPRTTANDRGLALELAWKRHLNGALDVPFRDLRAEEQAGKLPSLVFTPMMIEDGRQLIISNLNLDYMVETARDSEPQDGEEPERDDVVHGGRVLPDVSEGGQLPTEYRGADERVVPVLEPVGRAADRPGAARRRCRVLRQLRHHRRDEVAHATHPVAVRGLRRAEGAEDSGGHHAAHPVLRVRAVEPPDRDGEGDSRVRRRDGPSDGRAWRSARRMGENAARAAGQDSGRAVLHVRAAVRAVLVVAGEHGVPGGRTARGRDGPAPPETEDEGRSTVAGGEAVVVCDRVPGEPVAQLGADDPRSGGHSRRRER